MDRFFSLSGPRQAGLAALAKRLGRSDYLLSMGAKFLGAALSFLATLMVARIAGPAISGEYALAVQTVMTGSMVALFGNDQLLIRRMAGYLADGRQDLARVALVYAVTVVGTASLLIGAALILFSPLAPEVGTSSIAFALSSVGTVSYALLGLAVATMRATGRVVLSQFFYGVSHSLLLVAALGIIMILGGQLSVLSIVLSFVSALAVTVLVGGAIVRADVRGWPRLAGDRPHYRFADSGFIGTTVIIHALTAWLAMTGIARMVGPADLGAFRVCNQIITILTMIFTTVDSIVSPQFARDFRGGSTANIRRRYIRTIAILALFAGPPMIPLMLFPEQILSIFGPFFVTAATVLQVLVLGQIVNIATGPVGTILIMARNERVNFALAIGGMLLTLALLWLLVPHYGLIGAAWAMTAGVCLRNIGGMVVVLRMIRNGGSPAARVAV